MTIRRSFVRFTALSVVLAVPLLGMSGVASAQATKAAKGSPAWCLKHAKSAACKAGSGSGGATGGGSGPEITVQVDPQPLVETGQSEVHAVIQVETLPAFAGDTVNIDSSQLQSSCATVDFENLQNNSTVFSPNVQPDRIDAVLDDDGNATVIVDGTDCAPGTDVIEADLEVSPFLTAITTLVVLPPAVTAEGVTPYPQTGGLLQEVETGDTSASGDSNVYAVFYVETNPVYAEQTVEIDSTQLDTRCVRGWRWEPGNQDGIGLGAGAHTADGVGLNTGQKASAVIDDDGNAVFVFKGVSCAAGPSAVIAEVDAGSHPTYTTTFTVLPPTPGPGMSGPSVP
ncbi:MAG TPA: hypothetical protein VN799_01130 [Acidimicrobiales bacterium]|nr:hypothetical protein [Acidimicrobiales bacterium]